MKTRVASVCMAMAAVVLLATGCTTYDGRVEGPGAQVVEIRDVYGLSKDSHLRASVQVKNKNSDPVRLRYRFTWLDGNGMPVGLGTPTDSFLLISLAPYESRYIQGDAPNSDCVDFRVYIEEIN